MNSAARESHIEDFPGLRAAGRTVAERASLAGIALRTAWADQVNKIRSQDRRLSVVPLLSAGPKMRAKQIVQKWKAGVAVLVLVLCPHDVWVGLDQLACCIFFGHHDLTVSGLAAVVQRADSGEAAFAQRLDALKLRPYQIAALRRIGRALEWYSPGHLERTRLKDLGRAQRTTDFLSLYNKALRAPEIPPPWP